MKYSDALNFLYNETISFEQSGADGYKPGLERVEALLDLCGRPHRSLKAIHVAGTNGKGSTAGLIASILQASGYRVGLFTSPHFIDFRERIRINGEMIPEENVSDFVERMMPFVRSKEIEPSFFELTTAMAFEYFRDEKVDYAVIEVGMGGRLDSTNVITPMLSVITNVSLDHTQYLGDTLQEIAKEKAGIIKPRVPVVLGRSQETEVRGVVVDTAMKNDAYLVMADRVQEIMMFFAADNGFKLSTQHFGNLTLPLFGAFQIENAATVLQSILLLRSEGINIPDEAVKEGFEKVREQGIRGRLEVIKDSNPRIIVDSGHNPGSWAYLGNYVSRLIKERPVVCILGFSADKDIRTVLDLLPRTLPIIFTEAANKRAKKGRELTALAADMGFKRTYYQRDFSSAYLYALDLGKGSGDFTIFIGGSFYLTGEVYKLLDRH